MTRYTIHAFLMTALMTVAPASWAAPIDIAGIGSLGSFTGTLNYHSATASTAVLDVTLTNTSSSGYLTAIALNNPGNSLTGISLATPPTPTTFTALGLASNGVNAQPLGWFDFGAGTGGNWEGGGPPSNGLAANASATFRFNLVGTNLTALDTLSFATTFSAVNHNNPAPTNHFLAARFRGFANGGSDKVSASVVPLPAAVYLFGGGLIGLAGLARRRLSA